MKQERRTSARIGAIARRAGDESLMSKWPSELRDAAFRSSGSAEGHQYRSRVPALARRWPLDQLPKLGTYLGRAHPPSFPPIGCSHDVTGSCDACAFAPLYAKRLSVLPLLWSPPLSWLPPIAGKARAARQLSWHDAREPRATRCPAAPFSAPRTRRAQRAADASARAHAALPRKHIRHFSACFPRPCPSSEAAGRRRPVAPPKGQSNGLFW